MHARLAHITVSFVLSSSLGKRHIFNIRTNYSICTNSITKTNVLSRKCLFNIYSQKGYILFSSCHSIYQNVFTQEFMIHQAVFRHNVS